MNNHPFIINRTTSFCPLCKVIHSAHYEQINNQIYFIVDCPKEKFAGVISNNAKLFKALRERSNFSFTKLPESKPVRLGNLIEITNDCNFHCKFCFSNCNEDKAEKKYLSIDEVIEISKTIKKEKGYGVNLSGGEPTLHKGLPEMIRRLKKLGLMVLMASNGYLLGKNPDLAKILKKNGLASVGIQLDSINKLTHQYHRNNAYIEEKIQAIKNCVQAGLRVVITITVTKYNLKELGDLITFCLQFTPNLYMVVLQPYVPFGNTELDKKMIVDREETIESLKIHPILSTPCSEKFFRPIPKIQPLNLEIHPDCGALTALLIHEGKIYPIDDFIDIDLFYKKLGKVKIKNLPTWAGYLIVLYHIYTCAYRRKRKKLFQAVYGLMSGKGKHYLVFIFVEQFMYFPFQDQQRAIRCATARRTKNGVNQQGCFVNRINNNFS